MSELNRDMNKKKAIAVEIITAMAFVLTRIGKRLRMMTG